MTTHNFLSLMRSTLWIQTQFQKKQGHCPLTGPNTDFISVSGNSRQTYNMIACISGKSLKKNHPVYMIGKDNVTSASFVSFCLLMVESGWLVHDEFLVMDNAASTPAARSWGTILGLDRRWSSPLHVLVIYLPKRSPKLNPIKLIFHIFSCRIRSYRIRRNHGPVNRAIIHYGSMVMNKISCDILFGRGKPIQKHSGNLRLNVVLESLLPRYNGSTRQEKPLIVQ
jgi:hypothetical protein